MNPAIQELIKDWPKEPREAAQRLLNYYGEPDEHSSWPMPGDIQRAGRSPDFFGTTETSEQTRSSRVRI